MDNVFDYIKDQETKFKTQTVTVADGYEFNMYEHVRMSTLFRDSKYTKGNNDYTRPFKNIIRRIRNLALVTMDIDVKEIEPFVNEAKNYYKSFLVRKAHPKWARKYDIDTYIDDLIESYEDYGLALSKHVNDIRPEIVHLQSLAFCDQTDILSGPICIKHQYSPDQLKSMEQKKWENVDKVILLAKAEKSDSAGNNKKETPGKYVEVYELDGYFPESWLKDDATFDDTQSYSRQFHLVTFYQDEQGNKKGIHLFKGKGDPNKYKAIVRDKIFGRACGMGGIEELFHPQIWVNYDMIRIQEMIDSASKVWLQTSDTSFPTRNNVKDADNNEVFIHAEGKPLTQVNNQPVNVALFERAASQWEEHAQGIGSAYNAQLGQSPTAGTPFKLQELVTTQGDGLHEKRKGKIATHLAEIYRDWILDDFVKEINKGDEWVDDLSLSELEWLAEQVAKCKFEEYKKELLLNGGLVSDEEINMMKEDYKKEFIGTGSKKFLSVLKDEIKDLPVDVHVNIAGKQKDLAKMTDKLVNIMRQFLTNPQMLTIPGMGDIFNQILEASGLSPVSFSGLTKEQLQPAQMQQAQPMEVPEPVY